jgi:hypothetical protein
VRQQLFVTHSVVQSLKFVMLFNVGDLVRNKTTQVEARIVRIADLPGYGVCYIVSITPNPALGATAREVIWRQSEVTRSG